MLFDLMIRLKDKSMKGVKYMGVYRYRGSRHRESTGIESLGIDKRYLNKN